MTIITYPKYPLAPFQPLDRLTKPVQGKFTLSPEITDMVDKFKDSKMPTGKAAKVFEEIVETYVRSIGEGNRDD